MSQHVDTIRQKLEKLTHSIVIYEEETTKKLIKELLSEGVDPLIIVNEALIPAATIIGEKFENGEYFLPELLICGDLLQDAMKIIEDFIEKSGQSEKLKHTKLGKVVIATVRGDIHDIGKNLVAALLRANNFEVYDLGKDVESMKIVEKALEVNADIIALSALMTTTRESQREVISILNALGVRDKFKVMIGGGSTTPEWAHEIGADDWGETAVDAVRIAKKFVSVLES
jgi:corrinoid protein of di/trimethylamine methyltransferase